MLYVVYFDYIIVIDKGKTAGNNIKQTSVKMTINLYIYDWYSREEVDLIFVYYYAEKRTEIIHVSETVLQINLNVRPNEFGG